MADYSEIIERLEKLEGPDREVDAQIEVEMRRLSAYAAGLNDEQRAYWSAGINGEVREVTRDGSPVLGGCHYHARPFTTSLDATIALVKKVAPGWFNSRLIWAADRRYYQLNGAPPPTLAIALLLSMFRALEEREQG